eukprot:comp18958_c0_seq1/m.21219 comp18958_c0_seq1/g.21219  ORF comp18958_c0_seq1/g.21219 comp18958_c0_seq1/m.21219 type:complete len:603 (-) comp18958_c0_seq1:423-2231(-)
MADTNTTTAPVEIQQAPPVSPVPSSSSISVPSPVPSPMVERTAEGTRVLVKKLDTGNMDPSKTTEKKSVPVYVMMALDPTLNDHIRWQLTRLNELKADGVMFDVWWGWCEPKPQEYDFQRYVDIMKFCQQQGLKCQAVMSFHACGGNVGDSVNVPIPQWVHDLEATVPELYYKDQEGRVNKEYISLSCDTLPVFPSKEGPGKRTAVDCYRDYMAAFRDASLEFLEDGTLVEIQVGQGPCGELRYPAYPLSMGWNYPNVGGFQCYDAGMLRDLKEKLNREPPKNVGNFNLHPDESEFFSRSSNPTDDDDNFRSLTGAKFIEWYGSTLIHHGARVIGAAREVFPVGKYKAKVAGKVPGIHWLNAHPSHAAEVTAGLVGRYLENICAMLAPFDAMLDFTCLEMETSHQAPDASSRPERLVAEAMHSASDHNIRFAAENALPVWSDEGFNQIVRQLAFGLKEIEAAVHGFTLLRLVDELVEPNNPLCGAFSRFVSNMRNIGDFQVEYDCACPNCILLQLPEMPDISSEKSWKPVAVNVKEDEPAADGDKKSDSNEDDDDESDEEYNSEFGDSVPDLDNRADSILVTQRPAAKKKGKKALVRMSTAS